MDGLCCGDAPRALRRNVVFPLPEGHSVRKAVHTAFDTIATIWWALYTSIAVQGIDIVVRSAGFAKRYAWVCITFEEQDQFVDVGPEYGPGALRRGRGGGPGGRGGRRGGDGRWR